MSKKKEVLEMQVAKQWIVKGRKKAKKNAVKQPKIFRRISYGKQSL